MRRQPDGDPEHRKTGLNYLAIADNTDRAKAACVTFFERYYGKVLANIESRMIVGPPASCAERIANVFERGVHNLALD